MIKVYFPNLNGLRFIAAFLVIIHHIEQMKDLLRLENHWSNQFILIIGKLGVVLFFVLSGFLITFLLLIEENQTNTISIKSFYFRRILRIWPLYYLIIGLSFLIFSWIPFFKLGEFSNHVFDYLPFKLVLFLLFIPNLALVMFGPVPYASHTWSVGVEEQFYLIWPVLMKKFKNKKLLLYSIFFGYLVIKLFLFILNERFLFWSDYIGTIKLFFDSFSIDCMAIGGVFALYLYENSKILKILISKYIQISVLILLILLISLGIYIPFIHYEFYGILFGILIVGLASSKDPILSLENQLLNYLGKISYGLYIYHPIAIIVSIKLLNLIEIRNFVIQYLCCILLTILISGISYKYFESYFIRKKVKFSKIISGDSS